MSGIVERVVARQHGLFIYWLPVFFGAGIVFYFSLKAEPSAGWAAFSFSIFFALAMKLMSARRDDAVRMIAFSVAAGLCLAAAGFGLAQWRTHRVASPMLDHKIRHTQLTGTVESIEQLEEGKGLRLILGRLEVRGLSKERTPLHARVKVRQAPDVRLGQRVTMSVALNPPSSPVAPGAFDFQFYAWFRQIGAFGFAFHPPERAAGDDLHAVSRAERLRQAIGDRIDHALSGSRAALSIAMMTGEVSAVPEADWDAMRNSGLAHMLALSGTHVGLIAGFVFFFVRGLLAMFPRAALYWPIKKIAAVAAIVAAAVFVWLIGPLLPILRAWVMTNIVLIGVLADRVAISMRLLVFAALGVLAFMPEAVLGPSFQMSFAAVAGLILFFEATKGWWLRQYRGSGVIRKAGLYILGMAATTMVASLATAPFSLFHFQQFSLYGLPANLLAGPVMAFIVMPLVVVVFLALPLGLEYWPLQAMGWGMDIIMDVARTVAAMPQATLHLPAWPHAVMGLLILAAYCSFGLRGKARLAALMPLILSAMIVFFSRPPDILIAASGKLMAVRMPDGTLALSSLTTEKFSAENWMRMAGREGESPERWPREGEKGGMTCDEAGCRMEKNGRRIAFSFEESAQAADCGWADILVSGIPVRTQPCHASRIVDYYDLRKNGATVLWSDGRMESVGHWRGQRPWAVSNTR